VRLDERLDHTLTGAPVGPIPGTLGTDGSRSIGSDDVDMYEFTVASPGTVTIEIGRGTPNAAAPDSYLRLFDASGAELAEDDDSAGNGLSRIVISLPPGTYYAGVSGAGNTGYHPFSGAGTRAGAIGNFAISFALSNLDPNGLLSGAVNVNLAGANEPHQNFDGFIGADLGKPVGPADVDLFRIVVPDNGRLMVDIDTPYDTDYVNSYLRVFDAQGNSISDNDAAVAHDAQGNPLETTDGLFSYDPDSGDPVGHATDSFAIGQVRRGEVYYFGVSDAANRNYNPTSLSGRSSAGSGGFYRIFVSFANNDRNGAISQAVDTTLPMSPRPGVIGADGGEPVGDRDVDLFRVQPDESGILEINLDSYSLAANPSPVNTVLRLFASDGRLLASSDDIDGPDPLLRAAVVGGQVYFVGVSGAGNDNYDPQLLGSGSPGAVGDYRISMRLRPRSIVARLWDDRLDAQAVRSIQLNSALTANLGTVIFGCRVIDGLLHNARAGFRARIQERPDACTRQQERCGERIGAHLGEIGPILFPGHSREFFAIKQRVSILMCVGEPFSGPWMVILDQNTETDRRMTKKKSRHLVRKFRSRCPDILAVNEIRDIRDRIMAEG